MSAAFITRAGGGPFTANLGMVPGWWGWRSCWLLLLATLTAFTQRWQAMRYPGSDLRSPTKQGEKSSLATPNMAVEPFERCGPKPQQRLGARSVQTPTSPFDAADATTKPASRLKGRSSPLNIARALP